ncbi:MAG: DUF4390 domain-containing protein [Candidatus Electrothrix sp. AR3]|nr:DUF4390 domain-containing protein [Candidatus Electrothrix sp. AR3]
MRYPRATLDHYLRYIVHSAQILLLIILCICTSAKANDEPIIDDIIITTSTTDLLLFAAVKDCFTQEMLEGVRNAIPLTFRFDVDLYRIRNNWFDANLIEHDINHTLSYDPLKQEYQVAFAEKDRPEVTRSLDEAKQMMAELNGIKVIPLKALPHEATYVLHIKATLVENTFPLGIHSLIPFTSLRNFETEWRTIEFTY